MLHAEPGLLTLKLYGLGYICVDCTESLKHQTFYFVKCFKQRLIYCFTQSQHIQINDSGRYHHYKHYKYILNTERYLLIDIPFTYRQILAKFRCSNHKVASRLTAATLLIVNKEYTCINFKN